MIACAQCGYAVTWATDGPPPAAWGLDAAELQQALQRFCYGCVEEAVRRRGSRAVWLVVLPRAFSKKELGVLVPYLAGSSGGVERPEASKGQ